MKNKFLDNSINGMLIVVGYILSPLSWWNDLFINVPLAYAFSTPFVYINESWFLPMFIFGYWLSNIMGFLLMHKGAERLIRRDSSTFSLKKDLLVSIIYTILIVLAVSMGWINSPSEYI